jgi:hypothetical protein
LAAALYLYRKQTDVNLNNIDASSAHTDKRAHISIEANIPAWLAVLFKIILLFFAGFGPFFILRDSFFSLRNIFFCIPALALLVQFFCDILVKNIKFGRAVISILAAPVIFVCLLLSAGSVNAFRVNARTDRAIASQIIEILRADENLERYRYVWVLGARYQYTPHGGVHLASSVMADWALAGLTGVLEMEEYGERALLRGDGYFLRPVMAGETNAEIDTEKDIILELEPDGTVRRVPIPSIY